MFDKVSQPYVEIYDGDTNEYLGRSIFRTTPEVENAILGYARNEDGPNRIVFRNVYFHPTSPEYPMILPFKKRSRRGIFKAMLRDENSKLWIPIEIYARFNVLGRGQPTEDEYYFESVEYSDIVIEGMKVMSEQIAKLNK